MARRLLLMSSVISWISRVTSLTRDLDWSVVEHSGSQSVPRSCSHWRTARFLGTKHGTGTVRTEQDKHDGLQNRRTNTTVFKTNQQTLRKPKTKRLHLQLDAAVNNCTYEHVFQWQAKHKSSIPGNAVGLTTHESVMQRQV